MQEINILLKCKASQFLYPFPSLGVHTPGPPTRLLLSLFLSRGTEGWGLAAGMEVGKEAGWLLFLTHTRVAWIFKTSVHPSILAPCSHHLFLHHQQFLFSVVSLDLLYPFLFWGVHPIWAFQMAQEGKQGLIWTTGRQGGRWVMWCLVLC